MHMPKYGDTYIRTHNACVQRIPHLETICTPHHGTPALSPPLPSLPHPPPQFLELLPAHALPGAPEEERHEVNGEETCLEVSPKQWLLVVIIMEEMLKIYMYMYVNHKYYQRYWDYN